MSNPLIQSVSVLGSSSGRNAGDAALISGIMESVDRETGRKLNYEIPSIRPHYIRNHYPGYQAQPISMMPWHASVKMLGIPTWRSLNRTDLTLIFDAILFDRALYNPLFNFMSTLHLMLPTVKKRGGRMAFYNVGTGPVNTPAGRSILKRLSETMDFITVRDESSLEILKDLDVQNPNMVLGADAALSLQPVDRETVATMFKGIGLELDQEILAVNVNKYLNSWSAAGVETMSREHFLNVYAEAIRRTLSEIQTPLLLVYTQHHDRDITEALAEKVKAKTRQPVHILGNIDHDHYAVKGALGHVSLLFAMRLHALILASGNHTPIVGLNYQPKVQHYFKTLGLPDYTIDFDPFNADVLHDIMMKGWQDRKAIRAQLDTRIPALKERAKIAPRLVAAMDRGEPLDAIVAEA